MGARRLARVFARAGLHLGATTVRRMLQPKPKPPSKRAKPTALRAVTAKHPNHVWHLDLTTVPTIGGFWISWFPFALPQRWPFCWWVAAVVDHFSRRAMGTQFQDEAPDAGVAGGEAVVIDEVLPDRDRIAPEPQGLHDDVVEGLTSARSRRSSRANRRCRSQKVGGHLPGNGRFWRTDAWSSTAAHRDAGRLQIGARSLAADRGGLFDPPESPPQASERKDLLLFFVVQDIAHPGVGTRVPRRRQRLGQLRLMAGFEVSINGRF